MEMRDINMAEKAMIVNYILLTSQVVMTLEDAIENKDLSEQQYNFLKDGAELLSRIIEGATLIEGKKFENGVSPSMEGLSIYGYALSTIQKLGLIKEIKEKEFTHFFEELFHKMSGLIKEKGKADINAEKLLKSFFVELGSSFREDIQRDTYYKEKNLPFTLKKQVINHA
jgi:hypothetical protein